MNFPPHAHRDYSAAQRAAAEWLILRDSGLGPEQRKQLAAWLAADPEHACAFTALEETWVALEQVRELPHAGGEADPDALAPDRVREWVGRAPARRMVWWPIGLAASAAVVFALLGWSQYSAHRDFSKIVATEIGGMRKMDLPDGSMVRINTDSVVEVRYSRSERRVKLVLGEAHFTVTKNPEKPFIVSVSGLNLRAVGTAFNVRLRSETIEVLVTEGRVRVADSAKDKSLLSDVSPAAPSSPLPTATERLLMAGEQAVIPVVVHPVSVVPVVVAPVEVERTLAWQARKLEFVAVPLFEMAAEFNRYNRHKLVIADRRLAARRFGGTFRADGYETLVHLLETNHGIMVEKRDNETILRLSP